MAASIVASLRECQMCVLRVNGKHFDVDLHLAQSGLTAYKVYRVGEAQSASRPEGKRHEVSGFRVHVSRQPPGDLPTQIEDAIAFLAEHNKGIAGLRSAPGVDDMRLDFPVDLRIDRKKVMAQFDYFPPELVSLAGALGLGLELSIYPADFEELAQARKAKSHGPRTESGEDS
jgi:hypothetical protein